jgi:hypothetical protein
MIFFCRELSSGPLLQPAPGALEAPVFFDNSIKMVEFYARKCKKGSVGNRLVRPLANAAILPLFQKGCERAVFSGAFQLRPH